MTIRELRILPPFAIARLGSAATPLDNYTMVEDEEHPLNFRTIVPQETLVVDESTGEITGAVTPASIAFKDAGRIRPVAPFLELFARVDEEKEWQPVTIGLLEAHGLTPADITWHVTVANKKVERRTGKVGDRVEAHTRWFSTHESIPLDGHSRNFVSSDSSIDFGRVQYIKPNAAFPEIRFRFFPAKGLIYGPQLSDKEQAELLAEHPEMYVVPKAQQVYDADKGWYKFEVPSDIDNFTPGYDGKFVNETQPPSLFSIIPPAPCWLNDNIAISRGYFDDACDGMVEVKLSTAKDETLSAMARVTAGPPALVPDSLFVRSLGDDLDQVIFGPRVPAGETHDQTRARAEDIVRRAFETVRFLNVAVMNGNPVNARDPLDIDTMPAEEAFDVSRLMRPVFSEKTVDTLAIMRLHQQVYAALRGGAAPWFPPLLRRPDQVADFTDSGRRKMPALMCGADGNYLALTHRQIEAIVRAARQPLDMDDAKDIDIQADAVVPGLRPRNLSAQRHQDLHYVAKGNPVSSRPVTAIGNCTPGLEVDFRAVWRRLFEGIVLREYDNLVVDVDDPALAHLKGCRLMRVRYDGEEFMTMATAVGPSPADTQGQSVVYSTDSNPWGLVPLEWSNALASMLHSHSGKTVQGDFSANPSPFVQLPWTGDKDSYVTQPLKVRQFFEDDTAVISRVLAEAGELTQGLCSPWQNDYRECSCYYWASARPDFVNVEPTSTGASSGDNWLQKKRTGDYIPDDYVDSRLVLYDDLFKDWEKWLRFAVAGKDAPGESQG
ncbi:MAG: hypothetical protein ABJE47_12125 [bacterium]